MSDTEEKESVTETEAPDIQEEVADEQQEETPAESELDPVAVLEIKLAEANDQALRARADFDNYRKRMAREMERVRKTASEMLIHDILPSMDNLHLALQHADEASKGLAQGVDMVYKQMQDVLGNHGLQPIDADGQLFDPNIHEAVQQVASDDIEKDHIVQVFQTGYKLGEMILRPAKVVVSTGKPAPESTPNEEQSASTE